MLFLPAVFLLYWFLLKKKLQHQNLLLLVSSYVFYGWWDYRFLGLIVLSTVVDYSVGLRIPKLHKRSQKRLLLWISILFNLGMLGFFKYYNFFVDSWVQMLEGFGYTVTSKWTLEIVLPVGISFYTFQTMSYTIDIYRNKLKPTKDFISFAAFVAFFPQLVAGPIERATNLLPQMLGARKFEFKRALDGLRLVIWGLFKKVVIADSLAPLVETIFSGQQEFGGGTLWLGAIYFAFQIYGDFSGYSDIAIGTAKLFGFELVSNFKFPYFSRNIGEFWRRWHISLSTWFRDYVYIPLGGSREGAWKSLRNIFIIFIVSGFWHGANWTFIVWGGIHALLYVPSFVIRTNRKFVNDIVAAHRWFPTGREFAQIAITFFFVTVAWVFFRSENITDALFYIKKMFVGFDGSFWNLTGFLYILPLLALEWCIRHNERFISFSRRVWIDFTLFQAFIFLIFHFAIKHADKNLDFIYFQF